MKRFDEDFISQACDGEFCSICGGEASNKIGEEILFDDPQPNRHNLTAYICRTHFNLIFNLRHANN